MDNPELTKEWFVTHEGQQFGPVSMDDLRYEAERGELNPRIDLVWKDGMDGWIASGKIPGLFKKDAEAENIEVEKEKQENSESPPVESKRDRKIMKGKWGGTSRFSYLFFNFIFPGLLYVALAFGTPFLTGMLGEGKAGLLIFALILLPLIIALYTTINRFGNLAMSRLWFLALFVPILNIWAYSRLFSCPEGYADHKKLDPIGWLLAIIYWFVIIATLAAIGFLAFGASKLEPEKMNPDGIREMIGGYTEKFGIELPGPDLPETETPEVAAPEAGTPAPETPATEAPAPGTPATETLEIVDPAPESP